MAAISGARSSATGHRRKHRHSQWRTVSKRDGSDHLGTSDTIPEPDVVELRKARTAFFAKPPAERQRASSLRTEALEKSSQSKPSAPKPSSKTNSSPLIMVSHNGHSRSRRRSEHRSLNDRDTSEYVYSQHHDRAESSSSSKKKSRSGTPRTHRSTSSKSSYKKSSDRSAPNRAPMEDDSDGPTRDRVTASSSRVTPIQELDEGSESESEVPESEDKKETRAKIPEKPKTPRVTRPALIRRHTTVKGRGSTVSRVGDVESPVSKMLKDDITIVPTVASTSRRSTGRLSATTKPELKVECLTCASDVPSSKAASLRCGHVMCHECLIRIFTMSITDPQHMPPKCCTSDHIPLHHVDKLFGDSFKRQWNRKYQEFTTRDRIYCPDRSCGEWIKPKYFDIDKATGNKFAKCKYCRTKVCVKCNGKWHERRECPNDPSVKEFVQLAKDSGWQKCYNCKAMVELKEGCNHMTCRCMAEFCMLCAARWKTCDCPWFNHEEGNEQNVFGNFDFDRIVRGIPAIFRQDFGQIRHLYQVNPGLPLQPQPLGPMEPGPPPYAPDPELPQAFGYRQEMEARRQQEQLDEELARRMQFGNNTPMENVNWNFVQARGVYAMNDNYVRELAADAITAAFGVGQRLIRDYFNNADDERPRRRAVRGVARDSGRVIRRRASERVHATQQGEQGHGEQLHPRIRDLSPQPIHRYDATCSLPLRRASDMAGLGTPNATGSARVGGWLDHVE